MSSYLKTRSLAILAVLLSAVSATAASADDVTVTIASGHAGGVYHPVAGAICKLVNEQTAQHRITCTVKFGKGSVSNIEDLRDGHVTLAIAQADTQREAAQGSGAFADGGPVPALRSMFALFAEQVTILARADKGVASFNDLRGRRIYLPVEGSGSRRLMQALVDASGWGADAFLPIEQHRAPNVAQALCDGEFDAFSLTVGHPSPLVRNATAMCDAVLVPVSGPAVDTLIARESLYVRSAIPRGMYRGNLRDVAGLGVVATLVATSDMSANVAYQVTKAFFGGLERLRQASPLFSSMSAEELSRAGLTAPLHEGAKRYFDEAGLR